MKTKKVYIIPETERVMLNVKENVLQDTLQDTFSGGDPTGSGIVIGGGDSGEGPNQVKRWNSHLWDD